MEHLFVLLGYLGAGGLTFLWLRSVGLGVGASLAGGTPCSRALARIRAVQGGAGHLLAWIGMLLPLSLWAWERRLYWLTAVALASIPLSGQVHLARERCRSSSCTRWCEAATGARRRRLAAGLAA